MTKAFWNKEYANATHLALSDEPAEDLLTFARWAERNSEWYPFPQGGMVLDLGCGNGRNLIWLCDNARMKGLGIDSSAVAIEQASKSTKSNTMKFEVGSIADPIPLPDQSVDVVFDMMTSHFLNQAERESMMKELVRVMKPYGWLFMKTFVLDGDTHAKRLINDHRAEKAVWGENTYLHPRIKVAEHVFTESELQELLRPYFKIHKMLKSYKHVTKDGKPHKRRTISIYAERLPDTEAGFGE